MIKKKKRKKGLGGEENKFSKPLKQDGHICSSPKE